MWFFGRRNRRRLKMRERLGMLATLWKERLQRPVAIILVLGAIGTTFLWAYRKVQRSDHFRLKGVEVYGLRDLTPEEVVAACGLRPFVEHLLFLDVREVEERCLSDPRIRTVKVEVEMPDRLRIEVTEQDLAILVATEKGLWKANGDGEPWAMAEPEDLGPKPLLTGLDWLWEDLQEAREVIKKALELAGMAEASGYFEEGVVLAYDRVLGYTVHDTSRDFSVRFGQPPFEAKVERLRRVMGEAAARGWTVTRVLLDNEVRPEAVTVALKGNGNGGVASVAAAPKEGVQ